jgi:hypothetical protein
MTAFARPTSLPKSTGAASRGAPSYSNIVRLDFAAQLGEHMQGEIQ